MEDWLHLSGLLQCVAASFSELQRVAACCSVLQCIHESRTAGGADGGLAASFGPVAVPHVGRVEILKCRLNAK